MFSVLVPDYVKTLPDSVVLICRFYAAALRAQTSRELTSETSDSLANCSSLHAHTFLPAHTYLIYTRSHMSSNLLLEIKTLIEIERPCLHRAVFFSRILCRLVFFGRAKSIRIHGNDNYGGLISFSVFFDTQSFKRKFVISRRRSTSVALPHASCHPMRFDLSRAGCPTSHKHRAKLCTTTAPRMSSRMYSLL